jgi:hypothetical protein
MVLDIVSFLIVAGALALAARYPRVFGFFAWEFGVSWIAGESYSSHYLRAFKYWTSVCTLGALLVGLAYLRIDTADSEFAAGFVTFFAPLLLALGYLRSLGYLALHLYHKRRMTSTNIYVAGETYRASASGHKVSWGNQVRIELSDSRGAIAGRCVFVVHPEFERYEEFQAKSTDDLLQLALGQLQGGKAQQVLQAYREGGHTLFLPLNASLLEVQ